ncbi:MAG: helix-turn-helix transcriptional regulator [Oscillospiraceae bacterium]|nr:helix-turn-helix transcriptional regulator [Oscillospiraceae bacterium]
MIRNLNQLNFSGFGTVAPERKDQSGSSETRQRLESSQEHAPIYHAEADTWLYGVGGMTVLSVSTDGTDFQDFYLDKTVCIRKGVYFYIAPFRQISACADYDAALAPQELSACRPQDLLIRHNLQVTQLYTFFYQEKEQGFFFSGEQHPMLELTYVDQGSLHSVADGVDLPLSKGDMVIYGADQWHMQYADIGVAPRFVTISFDLEGSDLAPLLNRKISPPQAAVTLLQQMLREQEHMDAYSTDIIISQLNILLLILLRSDGAPAEKLKASNSLHSDNEIIRRAQQVISTHIREKLTVPTVAARVNVSPSYLTALFHKKLQISPGEYIRRMKLQESKQMIRENSMNFTQIAEALQYSTVHHFSRQFKEKFGITPSEYAKSVR